MMVWLWAMGLYWKTGCLKVDYAKQLEMCISMRGKRGERPIFDWKKERHV